MMACWLDAPSNAAATSSSFGHRGRSRASTNVIRMLDGILGRGF
jgi:hypothetical protein